MTELPNDLPEDSRIPLEHPAIPPLIREAVLEHWQPGFTLHRIPTEQGLEWWLFDGDGELVEAFWLD